jgi:hypothetical protein
MSTPAPRTSRREGGGSSGGDGGAGAPTPDERGPETQYVFGDFTPFSGAQTVAESKVCFACGEHPAGTAAAHTIGVPFPPPKTACRHGCCSCDNCGSCGSGADTALSV